MLFEYDGFKIQKTLFNETFEVIYSMLEVDTFLITGHSKGLIMMWEYNLSERVIKYECPVKDPITSMVYMKNSTFWVSAMNGDMMLLKINSYQMVLELLNQTAVQQPSKKIYSLTRLSDARICVATDKGFSVWLMTTLPITAVVIPTVTAINGVATT